MLIFRRIVSPIIKTIPGSWSVGGRGREEIGCDGIDLHVVRVMVNRFLHMSKYL